MTYCYCLLTSKIRPNIRLLKTLNIDQVVLRPVRGDGDTSIDKRLPNEVTPFRQELHNLRNNVGGENLPSTERLPLKISTCLPFGLQAFRYVFRSCLNPLVNMCI